MLSRRQRDFLQGKFKPSKEYRDKLHCEIRKKAKKALVDFKLIMECLPEIQQRRIFNEDFFPTLKAFNLAYQRSRYEGLVSPETISELSFQLTLFGIEYDPIKLDRDREYRLRLMAKLQKAKHEGKNSKQNHRITVEKK